jgi:hypothetical protein
MEFEFPVYFARRVPLVTKTDLGEKKEKKKEKKNRSNRESKRFLSNFVPH